MIVKQFVFALMLLMLCASCTHRIHGIKCPDLKPNTKNNGKVNVSWWKNNKGYDWRRASKKGDSYAALLSNEPKLKAKATPIKPLSSFQGQTLVRRRGGRVMLPREPIISTARESSLREIPQPVISFIQEEKCDKLITYEQGELLVILKEINSEQVSYVPCGKQDAEVKTMNCSEIKMIKFADGRIRVVNQDTRGEQKKDGKKDRKWIIAFGVFSLLILVPVFRYLRDLFGNV